MSYIITITVTVTAACIAPPTISWDETHHIFRTHEAQQKIGKKWFG